MNQTEMWQYNCCRCGRDAEIHHVFFGTYKRKISDKYNLVVPLCVEHHRLGIDAAHNDTSRYEEVFSTMWNSDVYCIRRAIDQQKHSLTSQRYLRIVQIRAKRYLKRFIK